MQYKMKTRIQERNTTFNGLVTYEAKKKRQTHRIDFNELGKLNKVNKSERKGKFRVARIPINGSEFPVD